MENRPGALDITTSDAAGSSPVGPTIPDPTSTTQWPPLTPRSWADAVEMTQLQRQAENPFSILADDSNDPADWDMEQQTRRQGKRPRPRDADKHVRDRHWKRGFAEDALQCGSDSDQEIEITSQTRTEKDPAQAKKATETANLYPNEVLQDTTTIIVRPKTAASILSIPDTVLNAWLKERLRSETPATIRKQLRANVIAVDIPADVETQPFLKIEKLGPVPVQAYVAPPRDAIKGVIYGVSTEFTDEDIRATIRPLQGGPKILNAYRLGKTKQTVLVVFAGNKLPRHVRMEYIAHQVQPFRPTPILCSHCQRIGHKANICPHEARCGRCGGTHTAGEICTATKPRCLHCQGEHVTGDPSCPHYKRELLICRKQAVQPSLTRRQAIARTKTETHANKSTSFEVAEPKKKDNTDVQKLPKEVLDAQAHSKERQKASTRQPLPKGTLTQLRRKDTEVKCQGTTNTPEIKKTFVQENRMKELQNTGLHNNLPTASLSQLVRDVSEAKQQREAGLRDSFDIQWRRFEVLLERMQSAIMTMQQTMGQLAARILALERQTQPRMSTVARLEEQEVNQG